MNKKPSLVTKSTTKKATPRALLTTLTSSLLLGLAALSNTALADTDIAEDYKGSAANVDSRAPIAALSKLTSLDNVAPLKMTVPDIEHFTTVSGVPVSFVRTTALPIVDIDLRFNAGSARDGSIRKQGFGIANMVATMLTQGTETRDEDDFTRAVETLGITLNSSAYKDMFIVSLRSLSDDGVRLYIDGILIIDYWWIIFTLCGRHCSFLT